MKQKEFEEASSAVYKFDELHRRVLGLKTLLEIDAASQRQFGETLARMAFDGSIPDLAFRIRALAFRIRAAVNDIVELKIDELQREMKAIELPRTSIKNDCPCGQCEPKQMAVIDPPVCTDPDCGLYDECDVCRSGRTISRLRNGLLDSQKAIATFDQKAE